MSAWPRPCGPSAARPTAATSCRPTTAAWLESGNQLRAELAESHSVREDLVKEVEAAVNAFAQEKTSGATEGG